MAEEIKSVTVDEIESTVKRIDELKSAREAVRLKNDEILVRQKDLTNAETLYGTGSKEYENAKNLLDLTFNEFEEANKKVNSLVFKKSELKPVLDELTRKFEDELRKEQSIEYHIEIAPVKKDDEGKIVEKSDGKKVFKNLLEYLYHNVTFTPKTAANLMVLVRNMEENKAWVNSKEFDNVIVLRSASVLSLWRFIVEDMTGKGFYEARTFLECWANCGQCISDTVREIQKNHEQSRVTGTQLNTVEEEFDVSVDDLSHNEEELSTQEEVSPEIAE